MQTKQLLLLGAGFLVITGFIVFLVLNQLRTASSTLETSYNVSPTQQEYKEPTTTAEAMNPTYTPKTTYTVSPTPIEFKDGIKITPEDTATPTPTPPQTTIPPTTAPPIINSYELTDTYNDKVYTIRITGINPTTEQQAANLVILNIDQQTKLKFEVKGEAFEEHFSVIDRTFDHNQLGTLYMLNKDNTIYFTNKQPKTTGSCPVFEELIPAPCGFVEYFAPDGTDDIPGIIEIACIPNTPENKDSSIETCIQVLDKTTFTLKQ